MRIIIEEAIEMIKKSTPDLLIIDFKMPRMCGDEVCKILKQDILIQHMPIIMLTGKGEVLDKIQGINAGADDYIVKPFTVESIQEKINNI